MGRREKPLQPLHVWLQQGNPGSGQLRQELAERVPEYTPQVTSTVAIAETLAALQPG